MNASLSIPPSPPGLRGLIDRTIIRLTTGKIGPKIHYLEPAGDPGLLGPNSVAWKVHADFSSMLAGGVSSLLIQAMHPLALAGVWDHSNFREDILGRLGRTAKFVAGTTYASRQDARGLIEHVRVVHRSVTGTAPDGRPYAASDPQLLTWVHVGEVSSFLWAHLRYVNPQLSGSDQDRYFEEIACVAEALGAEHVPKSRVQVEDYFRSMRRELEWAERQCEVLRILRNAPGPAPGTQYAVRLFIQAGIDLLPEWAHEVMGLSRIERAAGVALRPTVRTAARVLRWGHPVTLEMLARQRAGSLQAGL